MDDTYAIAWGMLSGAIEYTLGRISSGEPVGPALEYLNQVYDEAEALIRGK